MARRLTDIEHPQILYKYRDWDNDYHRQLLTRQTIYLSKPYDFNDPFDGRIPVRWDLMTEQDKYDKNLEVIKIWHKDKPDHFHIAFADKLKENQELWFSDKIAKERPEQLDDWNTKAGLISLSAINDNILMWSHYSNSHSGFTVGLWSDKLMDNQNFDYLDKVDYSHDYPIITGTEGLTAQFKKKMFSKSKFWEYENEWRITKMHPDFRDVTLTKDTFGEVIIGCQATDKTKDKIIKTVRTHLPTVKLFQAVVHSDRFELILKEIK